MIVQIHKVVGIYSEPNTPTDSLNIVELCIKRKIFYWDSLINQYRVQWYSVYHKPTSICQTISVIIILMFVIYTIIIIYNNMKFEVMSDKHDECTI